MLEIEKAKVEGEKLPENLSEFLQLQELFLDNFKQERQRQIDQWFGKTHSAQEQVLGEQVVEDSFSYDPEQWKKLLAQGLLAVTPPQQEGSHPWILSLHTEDDQTRKAFDEAAQLIAPEYSQSTHHPGAGTSTHISPVSQWELWTPTLKSFELTEQIYQTMKTTQSPASKK